MSKYEPSREELEAFITRAGFRWGWENLESAVRRMAEHACIELRAAHLAAKAEWPSEEDVQKARLNGYATARNELLCEIDRLTRENEALQSVRPPVGVVSDDLKATAIECIRDIRKHTKQVHDLPLLQQDLRRLANRIERKLSRHAPTKD